MKKDTEIKKRITLLLDDIGGNMSELGRRLQLNPGHLSMVMSTDSGISATVLKNLANIGVNMNWLLTGEGEAIWRKDQKADPASEDKIAKLLTENQKLKNQIAIANSIAERLEQIILKKGA